MQWTLRFIGLKLFLTLLVAGWQGYEETIRDMVRLGDVLRHELAGRGWRIVNRTPLPVACFQVATHPDGAAHDYLAKLAKAVEDSGRAWVSVTELGGSIPAVRACITNFRSSEASIDDWSPVSTKSAARPAEDSRDFLSTSLSRSRSRRDIDEEVGSNARKETLHPRAGVRTREATNSSMKGA